MPTLHQKHVLPAESASLSYPSAESVSNPEPQFSHFTVEVIRTRRKGIRKNQPASNLVHHSDYLDGSMSASR